MSDPDRRRAYLARAYARAFARGQTSDSGAQAAASPERPTPSRLVGYRLADVALLPAQARDSSFGCGNPLAFAELLEGQVVLDVGCGAGVDLLIAGHRVGPTGRVVGVDLTGEMLEQAAANVAAAGLSNAAVFQGVMEDLPILASTCDWVISNGAIGLSTDKGRVFREIARVLRPEGALAVADITADGLPSWVCESPALAASCLVGALSSEGLLEALRDAGLGQPELRQSIALEREEIAAILAAELEAHREALDDPLLETAHLGEGGSEFRPLGELPGDRSHDSPDDHGLLALAETLSGKVWSTTVVARKPSSSTPPP